MKYRAWAAGLKRSMRQTHCREFCSDAWVNDEDAKRAYEIGDDAYRVFRKMLETGHPPDDWGQLLAEAQPSAGRLRATVTRGTP